MERCRTFRLEVRKDVDHCILGITMLVLCSSSYMRMDHRGSVDYMDM